METTATRVEFAYSTEQAEALASVLRGQGYTEQDEDGICFGGVFVGKVFAKFTPWNVAYDFVILSIIPD